MTGFLDSNTVQYKGGRLASLQFGSEAAAAAAKIVYNSAKTAIETDGDFVNWNEGTRPATLLIAEPSASQPGEIRAFAAADEVTLIELVVNKAPADFTSPGLGETLLTLANGAAVRVDISAIAAGRTRIVIGSSTSDAGCLTQPAPIAVAEDLALGFSYTGVLRPSDVVSATVTSRPSSGGCASATDELSTVVVFGDVRTTSDGGDVGGKNGDGLFFSCQ